MHYVDVLARLHALIEPEIYLEIGVRRGRSLALCTTRAIAIDPDLGPVRPKLRRSRHITFVELESDQFFAKPTVGDVFGDNRVELAFIDGLHLSDQVVRDLSNVERWSRRDAVVAIHDAAPLEARIARREPTETGQWAGDIWRVVPFLRQHRPDLQLRLLDAEPTGLLMVCGLNPDHPGLAELAGELVQSYPADHAAQDALFEASRSEVALMSENSEAFLSELADIRIRSRDRLASR